MSSTIIAPVKTLPYRGSIYRKLVTSSGLYAAGMIAQRLASFLLLPVYTRYLRPSDYGTIDLVDLTVTLIGAFLGAQLSSALYYYYFQSTADRRRNETVSTMLLASCGVGTVAALVGWIAAPFISNLVFTNPGYAPYFRIVFLSFGFNLPIEAVLAWIRALDRAGLYLVIGVARLGVSIIVTTVLLVGFGLGIWGVLWSMLVVGAITAVVLACYAIHRVGLRFDGRLLLAMVRFSIPIAFVTIAMFVIHSGDRFILQRHTSLYNLGLYALAYKLGMLITLLHSSFQTFWSAQVYEFLRRDDRAELLSEIFTYLVLAVCSGTVLIIFLTPVTLSLMVARDYQEAGLYVPLLASAYAIRAAGDYFRCLVYANGRPEIDVIITWGGAGACLAGYFALIPRWHVWGAAVATLLAFVVTTAFAFFYSRRFQRFPFETARLAKVLAATISTIALFYCMQVEFWPAQLLTGMALFTVYVLLLTITGFWTIEEKHLVRAATRRIRTAASRQYMMLRAQG